MSDLTRRIHWIGLLVVLLLLALIPALATMTIHPPQSSEMTP